jgi:hypothetical protein
MESSERVVDASDTLTLNKIGDDEHDVADDFTAGGHSHDDDDDNEGDGGINDQIDKG